MSLFAARIYVEKIICSGYTEELVRILINNRVVWLPNCGVDGQGRCKLGAFVESLNFARSGGFWNKCFKCLKRFILFSSAYYKLVTFCCTSSPPGYQQVNLSTSSLIPVKMVSSLAFCIPSPLPSLSMPAGT